MSLDVHLGKPMVLASPLLDAGQLEKIKELAHGLVRTIDFTFGASAGVDGAVAALERIREEARADAEAASCGPPRSGFGARPAR